MCIVYPLIVFAFDIVIGFDWVECVAMADKMSTVVVATQSLELVHSITSTGR